MGWLCWNIGYVGSRKNLDELFRTQVVGKGYEVLKSCCRGYTWWVAAIREIATGDVFAATVLYHYNGRTGDFGYKWMDETYGPGYYNYPKSYYKLLTPTDSEFAQQWRMELEKRWKEKDSNKTRRN